MTIDPEDLDEAIIDDEDELPPEEEDDLPPEDGQDEVPVDDEGEDPLEELPARQTRGNSRQAVLSRQNRDLRERLARLEGHVEATARPQPAPHQDPRIEQQREQELLSTMTAEEKISYFRDKDHRDFGQALRSIEQRNEDRLDKIDFRAACAEDPALKAVAKEVETLKAKNPGVSREVLATYVIGQKYRQGGMKAALKKQQSAAATARKQKTRPPAGGGDVAVEARRGAPKTARERLEAAEAKGMRPLSNR